MIASASPASRETVFRGLAFWSALGLALSLLTEAQAADLPPAPAPAAEATSRFTMPNGFEATLFAGEPDVTQPIAFTFDDRGRMWVVECLSYPGWKGERKDRVVILEDANGDGACDSRKVFWDQGSNLSGIEWGFGGVWLCSTPNLVFVPDANQDDVPDGPEIVKLDGWDLKAKHNVFNSLTWGPDGWLYGCNGILSNSLVGSPGSSDADRVPINCGVWRYHPSQTTFEAVAHGTTNPWGLDFDDYGRMFITNCVIEHAWQIMPGGRYQRMFGQDFATNAYELLGTCADHIHWAGGHWTDARGGERHSASGGGHAHSGAMIYLGDNWPDEYRGSLLTCNIHGNRVNRDTTQRKGSSAVAIHAEDILLAGDPWFRGIAIHQGPEGAAYVSDWCDTGECHNYEVADTTNGRIYRLTHGKPRAFQGDLGKLSDFELAQRVGDKNEWLSRHARRLLQERKQAGSLQLPAIAALKKLLAPDQPPETQLRGLWALFAIGEADRSTLTGALDSRHDVVRGWGVRLLLDGSEADSETENRLARLAKEEKSAWTRLELAAGLQRLPLAARWNVAEGLLAWSEDSADAMAPLMLWYGIEPLVEADPQRALELAVASRIPRIRTYIARRLVVGAPADRLASALEATLAAAAKAKDDATSLELVEGVHQALTGRRRVPMPKPWPTIGNRLAGKLSGEGENEAPVHLALIFGDKSATDRLRAISKNPKIEATRRGRAIAALSQAKAEGMADLLIDLLDDAAIRIAALRGLAALDDGRIPDAILSRYASFTLEERREALATLAARAPFAHALFAALGEKKIERGDLTAFHVEQLRALRDEPIARQVAELWGASRATPEDRKRAIAEKKAKLGPDVTRQADLAKGRLVFEKNCSACHTLFGKGGKVGPELTGAQRDNLDYVLSNVLDPSATVAREYQTTVIETSDGRLLTGIVKQENDAGLTLVTATETLVVPKDEIETRDQRPISLMPDGLLKNVSDDELRDLVGFLASPPPK